MRVQVMEMRFVPLALALAIASGRRSQIVQENKKKRTNTAILCMFTQRERVKVVDTFISKASMFIGLNR